VDEPRLADPGDADERDELRSALLPNPRECADEGVELLPPSDQGRARLLDDVDAEAAARLDGLPDGNRLQFPLRLDRLSLSILDLPRRGAIRGVVRKDAVD